MEKALNFEDLKKNLIETVKESQLKLGYAKEPIRLYYPIESLNHLLDAELDEEEMLPALRTFCASVRNTLGNVTVSRKSARFCILIPEEGAEYVREQTSDTDFLKAFIELIRQHGLSLDDILKVFHQYSDHVICRNIHEDEFDYLIYFADGHPDDFRYCIKFEGVHATYHRFTPRDYEAFGFSASDIMP